MRITVFGATGPAGKLLTERAIQAGHMVTAFARSPAKLGSLADQVSVVVGELADAAAIDRAVQGADAVISLLGPSGKSSGLPISEGMRHIVDAMERHGVRRLIATATPSAADPNDRFKVSFWLAVRMIKALAGTAYADIVATAGVARSSTLDWTLLRLPMLTDAPSEHPAVAGYVGDPQIKLFWLSRSALADFILAQLQSRAWGRKAPVITNG